MFYGLFRPAAVTLRGYFRNVIREKERVEPYLFYTHLRSYCGLRFKEVIIVFKGSIYKLLVLGSATPVVRDASSVYSLALLLAVRKPFCGLRVELRVKVLGYKGSLIKVVNKPLRSLPLISLP